MKKNLVLLVILLIYSNFLNSQNEPAFILEDENGVVIENNINPPVPFTLEYEITVNFEGCEGNTVPFFITVNPSPIVSINPS